MFKTSFETLKGIAIIMIVIVFAYLIFANASVVHELVQGYGLVGLLVASIIANASIFLPVPIDFVVFAIAAETESVVEVIVIGLVVGFGAAIGEMTSYIMGLYGVKMAERAKHHEFKQINYVREKLGSNGMLFIFLGALTPFPFDLIGIAAGLIKYDYKKFFLAALAGKLVRYVIIGLAAFYGFAMAKEFFLIS